MRAAVYTGTRNVYEDMIPSMKSLLIHSNVDKIYFLIEDDIFPYELPPEVECINISNQKYFLPNSPNYKNSWSYIILLRAILTKIFPDLDKILVLDCDVIINENISELWDIDLDNYYIAGVREPLKSKNDLYVNIGVTLFNLKKLREDKKDDEIIEDLNTYIRLYPEQDSFNELCAGNILELPSKYNTNNYVKQNFNEQKIIHFAAIKNWQKMPIVEYYRNMTITRNQPTLPIKLDIIIPFYNNAEGLEITLKSIIFPEISDMINITVVDDCSTENYDDLKELFPNVNFLRLEKNSGPGVARQYGIDHTNGTHIMFIDTGDYLLSKWSLVEVIETINNNKYQYMYLWRWLNQEHKSYSSENNPLLHGRVFQRNFLRFYNIQFSEEGARSNEDSGFVQSCLLVLNNLKLYDKIKYNYFSETPIYMYVYDENSLVHSNNNLHLYKDHIKGLVINIKHIIDIANKNNINSILIGELMSKYLLQLYEDFLRCAKDRPEYLSENWKYIRDFYLNVYKKYEKINKNILEKLYSLRVKKLLLYKNNKISRINLNNFIYALNTYEDYKEGIC